MHIDELIIDYLEIEVKNSLGIIIKKKLRGRKEKNER